MLPSRKLTFFAIRFAHSPTSQLGAFAKGHQIMDPENTASLFVFLANLLHHNDLLRRAPLSERLNLFANPSN